MPPCSRSLAPTRAAFRLARIVPAPLALLVLLAMAVPARAQLIVDAGPDVVLECESDEGSAYTLNGSVSGSPGFTLSWSTVPEVPLDDDDTLTPTGEFPLGSTTVTLMAESGALSGSDSATVTVEDTEAPVVRAIADPMVLWPPNHEMRRVIVTLRVRDSCSGRSDYEVELVSAESDEPDDGTGDGNTRNDIQDASIGQDDRQLLLRAERQGGGDGRVYTLTYRVTDAAGNQTEAEALVHVPHDYSDVKDLLDDEFGGGELQPICPLPDAAAEPFVDAAPRIAMLPDAASCKAACSAWSQGCRGIVQGTTRCVASELKSAARLENAECKSEDDGAPQGECRQEVRQASKEGLAGLKLAARAATNSCDAVTRRCTNACDDLFDPNGDDWDDEGVEE